MGVYIKGMEMPKDKPLIIKINPDGAVSSTFDNDYRKYAAIPVPPHGRLIDTDAVSLEGGPYEYDEWCKWALEQYQDAPTVIPASKGDK